MFSAVLGVLLLAGAAAAQSSGGAGDPVSGEWSGSYASGADRGPVAMDLLHDEAGTVTGTVSGDGRPGQVRVGTFDAASGALHLEVEVPIDGTIRLIVLDATILDDVATGRVSSDGQVGAFGIRRAPSGVARQGGAGGVVAPIAASFTTVSELISRAAEMVPSEQYDYRPVPTVRTFAQLVGHLADSYHFYCAAPAGRPAPPSIERTESEKVALIRRLLEAVETCEVALGSVGLDPGAMVENVAHANLHYGNIVTYMRTLGLVPPSSGGRN